MHFLQVLTQLKEQPETVHIQECQARPARTVAMPSWLHPAVMTALDKKGINELYTHQFEAIEALRAQEHVMVVTPTASGKTLCYNLPVLDRIMKEPETRALYVFPTKALAQDQVHNLQSLITELGQDIKTYTYDGDTPVQARRSIRSVGHVVCTNPDMLHTAILPHHTRWVKLFQNLEYVVIDETHQYRGVFGSHFANVLRRLRRIAQFYGSSPRFVLCSATIANPEELAYQLLGDTVAVVDDNGAPQGAKTFFFYNPPVVNKELGIRKSALLEGRALARRLLDAQAQCIVFARSRTQVELLVTYLRKGKGAQAQQIRGYRGGYLPRERRAIERGLREGTVRGVATTNALELGVDIGGLDVSIMVGYPGTIASTMQQAGRAGRRSKTSAAVLIASSSPVDQFLMANPHHFFAGSPEHAMVNPDNLYILASHLKCAAFELPFAEGESFGVEGTGLLLDYMVDEGVLHKNQGRYFWMADAFPAEDISLRSAAGENFVVIDQTLPKPQLIGEVDRFAAPMLLHEEAIYIHQGQQYQVEKLDYPEKKAYVKSVDVDYYTDANLAVTVEIIDQFKEDVSCPLGRAYGEVSMRALVTMFKKIKLFSHENVGWGRVNLPEEQMHTSAYWVTLASELTHACTREQVQSGLKGLSHLLSVVAPLWAMCDARDLHSQAHVRDPFTGLPTIYLCDAYPGGVGLTERLYNLHERLLHEAWAAVNACECPKGCPACVGPASQVGDEGKSMVLSWLEGSLDAT